MQGLTLWSRTHFSGTPVPTESALSVCHSWRWLGGSLVWFEAGPESLFELTYHSSVRSIYFCLSHL